MAKRRLDSPTNVLECRTLGHAWFSINPPAPREGSKAVGHTLASFACERSGCGAEKHEAWHRKTGEIVSRRYVYSADYGPIPRDWRASDLRLELVKRWNTQ